jgi:hypothetical protein
MIGKTISHYKIVEKLPSTGLRTGGEGSNPALAGQALPTDRDKSSHRPISQYEVIVNGWQDNFTL